MEILGASGLIGQEIVRLVRRGGPCPPSARLLPAPSTPSYPGPPNNSLEPSWPAQCQASARH